MLKNRNDRGSRSTSSESDRKLFSEYVLPLITEKINAQNIVDIYQLTLFVYSDESSNKIVYHFHQGHYDKAFNTAGLPSMWDDYLGPQGELLIIRCVDNIAYLAIIYSDTEAKGLAFTLKYLERTKYIERIEDFRWRSLRYPV